ncbi:MAG: hypothetical protein IKR03_00430 [Clostridia bacterium]|nr:hypothetical protein [Clostridia bacterium]
MALKMIKRLFISLFFCLTLFSIFSCQATPEDEAIVEKKPITEIAETVTEDKEKSIMPGDIPERWDEEIEKPESKIKIIFRAEIDAPEEAEITVERFDPIVFDDEMLTKYIKSFLSDEYGKVKFLKWPNDVKQGYIDELIAYKRGTEVDGRIVTPPEDDPYIKELEEYIAELPDDKDEYVEPVLDYDIPYDSSEYRKYKSRGKNYFSAKIIGGKHDGNVVFFNNYIKGETPSTNIEFNWANGGTTLSELNERLNSDYPGSYAEDHLLIESAIENMTGDEDLVLNTINALIDSLGLSDKYVLYDLDKAAFYIDNTYVGGFKAVFKPVVNNNIIPFLSSNEGTGFINKVNNNYSVQIGNDDIVIGIVDNKLHYFNARSMKQRVKEITDNVKLLPFVQVQERIKKLYDYNSILDKVYGVDRAVVEIDRINLRMAYTRNEGEGDVLYSTPVWCVYGKYHMYKENGELYGTMDYNMMINAIDGSNMGS